MPDALSALSLLAPSPSLPTAGASDVDALAEAGGGFADVLAAVFAQAAAAPVQAAPAPASSDATEGDAAAAGAVLKSGTLIFDAAQQPAVAGGKLDSVTPAPAKLGAADAATTKPSAVSLEPAAPEADGTATAAVSTGSPTLELDTVQGAEPQGRDAAATAAGAKLPEVAAHAGLTPPQAPRRAAAERTRTDAQANVLIEQTNSPQDGAQPTNKAAPVAGSADAVGVKDLMGAGARAIADDAQGEAPAISAEPAASAAPAAAETAARETSEAGRTAPPASPIAARAGAETTAALAAQIVKKLDGQNTRFDVLLTPEGLGRVDVTVHIGRDGAVSAAFAFDQPQAASQLGARADELRQALQQAGFEVGRDALSFSNGDRSGGDGRAWQDRAPQRGAFAALFDDGEAQPAALSVSPRYGRSLRLGVDLKV